METEADSPARTGWVVRAACPIPVWREAEGECERAVILARPGAAIAFPDGLDPVPPTRPDTGHGQAVRP